MGPEEVDDANPIVVSVGWVVKETENNLTLAMDWADDNDNHTRGRIPKGMIVSRTELKGDLSHGDAVGLGK